MNNNKLIKILCSIPVVLIVLYFIPFLGVCLMLLRCFVYNSNKKKIATPIFIVGFGLLLLVPKGLCYILSILKLDINIIPYLDDILKSSIYDVNIINYGRLLIIIGIVFSIISFILSTIICKASNKLNSVITNYISEDQKKTMEISKQNDMEIKLKQERAKNTNYVKCPNCGSDNIISEKIGVCKFCRRNIVNNNFHE